MGKEVNRDEGSSGYQEIYLTRVGEIGGESGTGSGKVLLNGTTHQPVPIVDYDDDGSFSSSSGSKTGKSKKNDTTLVSSGGENLRVRFTSKGELKFEVVFLGKEYFVEVEGITRADLQDADKVISKIQKVITSALQDVEASLSKTMTAEERSKVRLDTDAEEGFSKEGVKVKKGSEHGIIQLGTDKGKIAKIQKDVPTIASCAKTAEKTNIYYDGFLEALQSGAKGDLSKKISNFRTSEASSASRPIDTSKSRQIQSQNKPGNLLELRNSILNTTSPDEFREALYGFKYALLSQKKSPAKRYAYCKDFYEELADTEREGGRAHNWGINKDYFMQKMHDFFITCIADPQQEKKFAKDTSKPKGTITIAPRSANESFTHDINAVIGMRVETSKTETEEFSSSQNEAWPLVKNRLLNSMEKNTPNFLPELGFAKAQISRFNDEEQVKCCEGILSDMQKKNENSFGVNQKNFMNSMKDFLASCITKQSSSEAFKERNKMDSTAPKLQTKETKFIKDIGTYTLISATELIEAMQKYNNNNK